MPNVFIPTRHSRGHGKMHTARRQHLTGCFVGNNGQTISASQQAGEPTTKRVTSHPDIGIGIKLNDAAVNFEGRFVILIECVKLALEAILVTRVGLASVTITDGTPVVGDAGTTTGKKQVVIDFVLGYGLTTGVKDCGRGAFDGNDDNLLVISSKDMAANTIFVPAEVNSVVPRLSDVGPVASIGDVYIGVGSHVCEHDNSITVREVRNKHVIRGPIQLGGLKLGQIALAPSVGILNDFFHAIGVTIFQTLDGFVRECDRARVGQGTGGMAPERGLVGSGGKTMVPNLHG